MIKVTVYVSLSSSGIWSEIGHCYTYVTLLNDHYILAHAHGLFRVPCPIVMHCTLQLQRVYSIGQPDGA